ncbi:MAG: 50S ribosomal protein L6 [Coprothermobacterota bacterium]|jgi:large subunit ribosomal protein L6|nr:50S ribosomal protein L6 [Caldisericota bacterium]MDI6869147.1 50S ribosomal protein L6 [Coprothermobacterota bacterium]
MSRIGKKPIPIPPGVTVDIKDHTVRVKGPKGVLEKQLHPAIQISLEEGKLVVRRPDDDKERRALHGLTRALLANMVKGVTEGFSKVLELSGVGYKAQVQGDKLVLNVGYTHPVVFETPPGISVSTDGVKITVSGIDKEAVGALAAQIRATRNPDPYKAKGVKYEGEIIRRKAGKALGKGTGK